MKQWKKGIFLTMLAVLISMLAPQVVGTEGLEQVSAATPKLSSTKLTLVKGETKVLKLNGSSANPKWTSSKNAVASVTSTGKITAKKKGSAVITAQVKTKKYTCKVTVEEPSLSKTSVSLNKGKTYTLQVNGSTQKATYKSSKTSVATVTSAGKITAKAAGSAVISVKIGTKTYSCKVTVKNSTVATTGIKMSTSSASVMLGKTVTLKATVSPSNATNKTVTWSTSSSEIATVSASGKVTAKKIGTCTIYAKSGNYTAKCTIKVTAPPIEVRFAASKNYTTAMVMQLDNYGSKPLKLNQFCLLDTDGLEYNLYTTNLNAQFIDGLTIPSMMRGKVGLCRANYNYFWVETTSVVAFGFSYDGVEYVAASDYYGSYVTIILSSNNKSRSGLNIISESGISQGRSANGQLSMSAENKKACDQLEKNIANR